MKTLKLLLLGTVLFYFTGCEDKKTEPIAETNKTVAKESNKTVVKESDQEIDQKEEEKKAAERSKKYSFVLSDINDSNRTISIENKHITISDVAEKLILINFFATWCPPCKGEIPYLADLQKKYDANLFIAGILVNDPIETENLKTFISQYAINYFVSNATQNEPLVKMAVKRLQLEENYPLPLTILFKNGNYYSHYEGAVPMEMLEHDIKNAISKE